MHHVKHKIMNYNMYVKSKTILVIKNLITDFISPATV